MKNIFREFFTFNKRERNGVFILLSIICVLVLYLNISSRFISDKPVDFAQFDKDVEVFRSSINETDAKAEYSETNIEADDNAELKDAMERFNFNPNNLPDTDWNRLGLNDKQIKTIKNYESKGGQFRKKEDLKKIYGISEELYISLEPYIQLASRGRVEEEVKKTIIVQDKVISKNIATTVLVELNTTDSATLTKINGIGPFYAKKIIEYRNSIGGFVAKEQLLEIWKFDQEKLDKIAKYIFVDPTKIKKVNINICEAKELKKPFMSWTIVNAIVNYRKHHGNYKTIEDIKKTDVVNDELYRKIAPYLEIEN